MPAIQIRVEGLKELQNDLRRVDSLWGKEMGQVNKSIGTQVVGWSDRERSQMASRYPSYRSDIVKVKGSANQRRVEVTVRPGSAEVGTARHPVFGTWKDQGTFVKRVWPEPNKQGWLVRPTLGDKRHQIEDEYVDALTGLIRRVLGG